MVTPRAGVAPHTRKSQGIHAGHCASPSANRSSRGLAGFPCLASSVCFYFLFSFFIHLPMYNSGKIINTASLKLHFTELFSADHKEAELTQAVPLTER